MRIARKGHASAYDYVIFSDNSEAHRTLLTEIQWQIENGPGEDLAKAYGQRAMIKLTTLKIPVS